MDRHLAALIVLAACGAEPGPQPRRAGADCQLVAEAVTTIELGNYVPVQERLAREKAMKSACEALNLSKADGDCILTSKTASELAWCPHPLIMPTQVGGGSGSGAGPAGPGSPQARSAICETYVRTLERFARCSKLPAETARSLRQQIPQLRTMYTQYSTQSTEDSCKMANDATTQAMVQIGC